MIEHGTVKLADKVLTINRKLRDYVIKIGASPESTEVLGAGIDFKRFDSTISGDFVRKAYGLAKDDIVLFFMGWLYHFSGLKEVASQLAELGNDKVKLLIVGEGDAYVELQQIREKYKLSDRLILAGQKPYSQIPAFIAASDVCLLPAYPTERIMQDIVPIKMYEYLAMGKPVIVTKLKGVMKEFGKNAGVVYVDKPEDVIKKAIELVPTKLKELRMIAKNYVTKYSWDNITDEFEKTLKQVVDEKSLPRS
jgi:glycosyltransferase involved in cell wall biosynthesis